MTTEQKLYIDNKLVEVNDLLHAGLDKMAVPAFLLADLHRAVEVIGDIRQYISDEDLLSHGPKDNGLYYVPWDELHERFKFQAYDEDGSFWIFEERPYVDEQWSDWVIEYGFMQERLQINRKYKIPNWRESLIQRPNP